VDALKEGLERAGHEANLALQQRAENECLRICADQGWGLDPQHFASSTGSANRSIGGGNEHDVFLHEESQRVVKITKIGPSRNYGAQGTPLAYLTNLELQNSIFGDDLRFEGLFPCDTGYAIVTSQPFIEGTPASLEEIDDFFESLGFTTLGDFSYRSRNATETILLFDCRPDNIFCSSDSGELFPIDIQIKIRKGNGNV